MNEKLSQWQDLFEEYAGEFLLESPHLNATREDMARVYNKLAAFCLDLQK